MKFLKKLGLCSKEDFFKLFIQSVKFGIVGVSNTFVSSAIYYLVIWLNPMLYKTGYLLGFLASVCNAFLWNRKLVFQGAEKERLKPFLKSFVVYGGTFLLSLLLLEVYVSYLHISKIIAPLINLAITVPLNFLFIKLWAFKEDFGGVKAEGSKERPSCEPE